jgi:hypothetical protein
VEWLGDVRPSGSPATPMQRMTMRDLFAELTWVEDHLRLHRPSWLGGATHPVDVVDEGWLRRRESEICAELRRRRRPPGTGDEAVPSGSTPIGPSLPPDGGPPSSFDQQRSGCE